ncbi:endoglucanase [Clostridium gelidum]|uniref:Glucanase n=1 Tax=Clostridium gelidum TaxID=704125 RepID=A0ABM7T8Y9_9CLOT|nr:glycoside hydrolase family 9 protein [Clostridium gelidum]BCZ47860.1 endoglucanase [Clostridium gelidum]
MIRKKVVCLIALGAIMISSCMPPALANAASSNLVGAGNLIRNSTFDSGVGLPWTQVETYPAHGEFDISDGKFNITVIKPDEARSKDTRWAIQFRHRGLVLEQGHTYDVSFTVTPTVDCKIYPKIGQQGDPYKEYWNNNWEPISLKANVPTTFNRTFRMNDATDKQCEFAFHLVGDCTGATLPYTVSFDNIYVKDPQFKGYEPPILEPTNAVRVNQVGYFTNLEKKATVVSSSTIPIAWRLLNSSNTVVKSGITTVFGKDSASGDKVHTIDFSDYKTEGTGYKLEVDSADVSPKESMKFKIGTDLYTQMKSDAIKYFYHNRSGIDIKMPYSGRADLARPAGHPSDVVSNAPGTWYNGNYTLDVTGGWYDAGDHGKYVVNGGISTWTMMNQYERALYNKQDMTKTPFGDNTINIPESGNGKPDILDESRWNLEALLKMQVPAGNELAGMVHHKAHDERWTALAVRPDQDPQKRFIQPPSTAATLNLAAIAAQGARTWKTYDNSFANKCLSAAEKAWDAAVAHPDIYAPLTGSVGGGNYGDDHVEDEFYWAACELYTTTGESKYLDYIKNSKYYLQMPTKLTGGEDKGVSGCFNWGNIQGLGTITLALVPNGLPKEDVNTARNNIKAAADTFIDIENKEGYGTPMSESPVSDTTSKGYPWGSNSTVANEAIVMAYANDFSGKTDSKYINGTARAMDYLLGCNANVQSYITGYGSNPLENPHHRFWSYQADNSFPKAPAGCMSGGPNSGLEDPWVKGSGWKPGVKPGAKCFMDNIESWSTNEITINWNAPFAWITSYMDDNGGTNISGSGIKGDLNSDSEVDSMDYIALQKYIMDPSNSNINTANADLNSDGKINTADLFALRKIITSN